MTGGMRARFSEVVQSYSVIFFDAYGVLKNPGGIIRGVPEVLQGLRQAGKDYYVITNDSSRSPQKMAEVYRHERFGELIPAERNISSGLLASDYLRSTVAPGKKVAYLGSPTSAYYIEHAELEPVPVGKCVYDEVEALVLLDDEGFDWFSDLNRTINLLRRRNVPMVVANADYAYPVSGNEVAVAVGSLANMIENVIGKEFIRFGKPDTLIYSYAMRIAQEINPGLERRSVLMVGDTLRTDVRGANKFGIDTVLVLSGNVQPERAEMLIDTYGIVPTYICDSILT